LGFNHLIAVLAICCPMSPTPVMSTVEFSRCVKGALFIVVYDIPSAGSGVDKNV